MRRGRLLVAASAAVAVIAGGVTPATGAESSAGSGLWEANFIPEQTDCGTFESDGKGFCVADDGVGVELGVRFQVTEPVLITGVRMYRADAGELRASLWSTDGEPLAQTTIAAVNPEDFTNGWQDVPFTEPVPVPTEQTFIASYYSPSATYGFEYDYFAGSAHESGPLLALQSIQGSGNGVFCYAEDCYPDETFRDSNYWVSPLWQYPFEGFSALAEADMVEAKAGRAIPVQFSLGGDYGLDILADGYPKATPTSCGRSAETMTLDDSSTSTAGDSGLRYDAETGEYMYVWKTPRAAAGCYEFQLGLVDGSENSLTVNFVK